MRKPLNKPDTKRDSRFHRLATAAVVCLSLLSWAALPVAAANGGAYLIRGPVLQEGNAQWAAAGGGLLVTGNGKEIRVTMEDAPSQTTSQIRLGLPSSGGALFGRYAYVILDGAGVEAYDLSAPASPVDIGLVPLASAPRLLTQAGDALALFDAEGMKIERVGTGVTMFMSNGHHMGLSDPTQFTLLGSLPLMAPVTAATADGQTIFAATSDGRLLTIDISDALNPLVVTSRALPESAASLAVSGNVLFVSTLSGRFLILDLSAPDPSGPLAETALRATSLISEGRLLLAATDAGVVSVSAGRAESTTVNVNVSNTFFSPSTVSLSVGDAVKWTWVSGSHSSTSGSCGGGNCTPDGIWDSGVKSAGTFTHSFASAGDFKYFCGIHQSSMTGVVKVAGAPVLSATASGTPASGAPPLQVHFTGSASGGTSPYTYAWDFGDGATSTDQSPDHTYAADGNYSAVLTVHDSAAGSATSSPVAIAVSSTPPTPPAVSSMAKKGSPFRILVSGSNFQSGIQVFINGTSWTGVTFGGATSLTLTGGKSLKKAVPKNTPTSFRFVNPDGGEATFTFQWP